MLQNLLASIGILAIIVVTFARMTLQPGRLRLKQPAKSARCRLIATDRSRPLVPVDL